jgi:diguanylate cyclase (GGDEF)-like protein
VDGVGRYGGEEFLVVMTDCSSDSAYVLAKRIKDKVEHYAFLEGMQITVSIGISDCSHCSEHKVEALIKEADRKMYESKEKGRNCITM